MSLVAVTGDCVTTTTLALAAAWPRSERPLVVEADPKGGSLAGWFDVPLTPSLSTIVAAVHGGRPPTCSDLDDLIRTTESGVSFVPAPYRHREAARTVSEAWKAVLPSLAARDDTVVVVDLGHTITGIAAADDLRSVDAVVVTHRQDSRSPGAAAANLERLREVVGDIRRSNLRRPVVLAVIGAKPFEPADIADDLAEGDRDGLRWAELAVDPLAAASIAGRRGVSARRMSRLPLSRTAATLADEVRDALCEEGHLRDAAAR